jgi:hypothetical protein
MYLRLCVLYEYMYARSNQERQGRVISQPEAKVGRGKIPHEREMRRRDKSRSFNRRDAMRALVNENAKIETPQMMCHSEEEESRIAWLQPASYNGMNKQIRIEIQERITQA